MACDRCSTAEAMIPTMRQPSAAVAVNADSCGRTAPRAVKPKERWTVLANSFCMSDGKVLLLWFEEEKFVEMVANYLCFYDLSVFKPTSK